jgi:hypothetical protein
MRFLKAAFTAGVLAIGVLGATAASAASTPSAAMQVTEQMPSAVQKTWHNGRPHYVPAQRPGYRPRRPAPRVVCHTQWRTVRTARGTFIRRPVQVCNRRW